MNSFISNLFGFYTKRLVLGALALVLAQVLSSAPDPNIFDGSRLVTTSESSGNGSESAGKIESDSTGDDEASSRDFNQIGEVTSGETVPVQSSKSGESAAETAAEPSTVGNRQMTGDRQSANERPSTGAASSTESTRSFDEFEIGSIDATQPIIEAKSSKKPLETPASVYSSTPVTNPSMQDSSKVDSRDASQQEQSNESGSADYGTEVPSGL